MTAPVAHQIADGGGHKGSHSLRTRRIAVWWRGGVECGDREALQLKCERSHLWPKKLGAIRAQNQG
jgi:hypothetical protein